MDCGIQHIIIATVRENCLVMLVFDVPYQHGCKKHLLDWVEEAAAYTQHSAAATFAPLAAHFVCECGRFSWI